MAWPTSTRRLSNLTYLRAATSPKRNTQELNILTKCFVTSIPCAKLLTKLLGCFGRDTSKQSHSNDEEIAPLAPLAFAALHHYWFGPTEKGKQAWKANPEDETLSTSERGS